jgi:UDP-2,4-diacetamido-2,4,6-trideoxy-beta-L-altropyranose hydrolase
MKVFIITEGSSHIGFGHITRCLSLYQAFEEKGIEPFFFVNGDNTVKDFLRNINHDIFNWANEDHRLSDLMKDTDIGIIDSYLADYTIYEKISNAVKVPVYIDDNIRIDYPKGIVVNGTIYADEMNYQQKKDITYLLGSQYIPLRKEFWNVPEKEIKENIKKVMITFGGDDSQNMTPKVLNLLNSNFTDLIKKVVIGKGFKNTEQIQMLKDRNTELVYHPDAKGMKNVMLESDLAISAGGQTLYELARVGVPTIAIAVADNQMNNVRGWQKAGFSEYAGWWEDGNSSNAVMDCFKKLYDRKSRLERSSIGKQFVDGKGNKKIIDILLNQLN